MRRDRTRPAEKRKDCGTCQGTGRYLDVIHLRDRKTGEKHKIKERVKCPKCKGRGYR